MSGRRVSIALTREPRSVGKLAEELEISPPAATWFVDRVAEHAMAERRHDPTDGCVVLVDYGEGIRDVTARLVSGRRAATYGGTRT